MLAIVAHDLEADGACSGDDESQSFSGDVVVGAAGEEVAAAALASEPPPSRQQPQRVGSCRQAALGMEMAEVLLPHIELVRV
eukprot:COSAG01_NODE_21430_length_902_cov_2.043587_2_plen_82_part_00